MRKFLAILIVLSMVLGPLAVLPAYAQGGEDEDRWDGADDLPVNPLPCGDEEPEPPEPKEYDGGQPVDPPDLAGKDIVLVDVPKLIGIGYFAATTKGMQEAAEELGNVKVTTDALLPTIRLRLRPFCAAPLKKAST